MNMVTPILPADTPLTDDELPVFHICPTCGCPALSGKSARYATRWERVHGRSYPNIDFSIACPLHEAA